MNLPASPRSHIELEPNSTTENTPDESNYLVQRSRQANIIIFMIEKMSKDQRYKEQGFYSSITMAACQEDGEHNSPDSGG